MAAPDEASILNMTGIWSLNPIESDDLGPTFMLQNIPWIVRKVISYASLELKMDQKDPAPPERPATVIDINQTVRPGGFDTANSYILDGETRHDKVPIFGAMSMRAKYVPKAEVSGEDLMGHEIEQPSPTDERVGIKEFTEGVNTGWKTTALWGFEKVNGERRFCKYCTTTKGDEKVQARLVYDYRSLAV
ncbi:hypothetical protein CDEST_01725 [Colletotrichum destructivum]|uniref:Uncharacterized protein n=1 Tax=Colletotrichum destructivum TaxID=34406 RepID=A0AAX4I0Q6_9PEZI|nr:hypothetical protein CDEST_01725 [Colletotrichum destructivum]